MLSTVALAGDKPLQAAYLLPQVVNNFQANSEEFESLVEDFKTLGIRSVSTGLGTSDYPQEKEGMVLAIKQKLEGLRTVVIDEAGDGVAILVTGPCFEYSDPEILGCANSEIYYVKADSMLEDECEAGYSYLTKMQGDCMVEIGDHWYLWHIWTQHAGT